MNVWIPWEATATSECPVPEGTMGLVKLPGYETNKTADFSFFCWRKIGLPSIIAYMVTGIKEQGA
jgi:hypothetical protein